MRIGEYRQTDRYRKTARWASVLAPVVFFGLFGIGYLNSGSDIFGRYFSEALGVAFGLAAGIAVLLLAVPYVLWLFGLLGDGFRRLGIVLVPVTFVLVVWINWRSIEWPLSRARYIGDYVGIALPLVLITAAVWAVYVLAVHAWHWVREGFQKGDV